MSELFMYFGAVCFAAFCFGFLLYATAIWRDVINRNCHAGLRNRISDTVADISSELESKDSLSRDDVIVILKSLHNGYWPNIQVIACNAKARGEQ